ncbi:MAG: pantoate--beta-alanine ligase [Pirellulaceae bacterium]|nr:pantoate--beta-alanine ligase [Pirellulaceae bacterium]
MKVIASPHEAYAHVSHWRREGLRIGLVPTMGALHAGHLALVQRSVSECDVSVATIFVNPTQFAPHEDLSRYPRTLESDLEGLRSVKCDLVFVPQNESLYPAGFSTYVEPPEVAQPLEGVCRPGHYRGVCTIVLKLFGILPATVAYFGQKDYQQLAVIRRMVEDLNVNVRVEGCPTVREPDGLAMSSRNRYLTPEQRQTALCLWKALTLVQQLINDGQRDIPTLEAAMQRQLVAGGADRIDYARIVHQDTLADLDSLDQPAIALIAARVGTTRLIDNLMLTS